MHWAAILAVAAAIASPFLAFGATCFSTRKQLRGRSRDGLA
jgi:hypothetical protein